MTRQEALDTLGIRAIRRLSDHTTVIEMKGGGTRPAQPLELRMWALIKQLCLEE